MVIEAFHKQIMYFTSTIYYSRLYLTCIFALLCSTGPDWLVVSATFIPCDQIFYIFVVCFYNTYVTVVRFFNFFFNMALNDYEIETFLNIPIESEDEYADGFELSDDEDINEVNNKFWGKPLVNFLYTRLPTMCTSIYFRILPCTSKYFHVLPCISIYFQVLPCISVYFQVLPYNSKYFHTLLSNTSMYISKYFNLPIITFLNTFNMLYITC